MTEVTAECDAHHAAASGAGWLADESGRVGG